MTWIDNKQLFYNNEKTRKIVFLVVRKTKIATAHGRGNGLVELWKFSYSFVAKYDIRRAYSALVFASQISKSILLDGTFDR